MHGGVEEAKTKKWWNIVWPHLIFFKISKWMTFNCDPLLNTFFIWKILHNVKALCNTCAQQGTNG
jgi:hypothetical protein